MRDRVSVIVKFWHQYSDGWFMQSLIILDASFENYLLWRWAQAAAVYASWISVEYK